jgi:hypothetical protein
LFVAAGLGACGDASAPADAGDAARDAPSDASPERDTPDAPPDVAPDASPETGADVGPEGGSDADAQPDAGADASDGSIDRSNADVAAPVSVAALCGTEQALAGDFDGDDLIDCVTWPVSPALTNKLFFRKGLSGGGVSATTVTTSNLPCFTDATPIAAPDLGGDGKLDDLVVVHPSSSADGGADPANPFQARWLLGQTDGHFICDPDVNLTDSPVASSLLYGPTAPPAVLMTFKPQPTFASFNGAVVAAYVPSSVGTTNVIKWTTFKWYPLRITAVYTETTFSVGSAGSIKSIAAADVNGDQHTDLVSKVFVRNADGSGAGDVTLTWLGVGDGTFLKTPPP